MKITIVIDSDKVVKIAKRISLILVAIAVVLFLVLSSMIFKYSVEKPVEYEFNYNQLSTSGKVVATSMQKTGEAEDTVLHNKNAFRNTKKKSGKNAFFDSVSNNHRADKK